MHVSSNMELKGKPVQVRYGPATVKGSFLSYMSLLKRREDDKMRWT